MSGMLLTEVDVFGVYISPYVLILGASWGAVFVLRVVLTRLGVLRHAWHPALLIVSVFVAVFSLAAMLAMGLS